MCYHPTPLLRPPPFPQVGALEAHVRRLAVANEQAKRPPPFSLSGRVNHPALPPPFLSSAALTILSTRAGAAAHRGAGDAGAGSVDQQHGAARAGFRARQCEGGAERRDGGVGSAGDWQSGGARSGRISYPPLPPPPPPEQVASMGKSSGAPKSPQGASSLITGEDTLVDKVPPPLPLAHPHAPHDA